TCRSANGMDHTPGRQPRDHPTSGLGDVGTDLRVPVNQKPLRRELQQRWFLLTGTGYCRVMPRLSARGATAMRDLVCGARSRPTSDAGKIPRRLRLLGMTRSLRNVPRVSPAATSSS